MLQFSPISTKTLHLIITCTINVKFWESCRLDTTEIKKAITESNSDKID